MSLRGRVNGLGDRPHHIKRLVAEELRKRQQAGGKAIGHIRAAKAEALAVQATLELIQDRRTALPEKRPKLQTILRMLYRSAYHKGYQSALMQGYRKAAKASEAA
jgi:hypothetical protein